jgi:predicted lipid-binding transport protein (Tim44 family)
MSATVREAETRQPAPQPPARPSAAGRALGAGVGVLGGEGLTAYLHPALGEALAVANVMVPLAIALVLVIAIVCGSNRTCERVFRLLRWIANRPEPPAPIATEAESMRQHRE